MRNRRSVQAFTLIEILVVISIMGLLSSFLGFVVAPAVKEKGTQTTCASNMRQIVSAYRLYANDNDDKLPQAGWDSAQMRSYLKASPASFFCPKRHVVEGVVYPTYVDLNGTFHAMANSFPDRPRELGNGLTAPRFDPERDAILKCNQHGIEGYDSPIVGTWYTVQNLRGRVLTAYLDGRTAFAPLTACWQLPYRIDELSYRQHPELIRHCDGTLEKEK
ncbi:hypothetical protein BH11ARM2_BH11ARM2_10240 [soil metagenome]